MNNIAKALDAILGDIKNLAESLAFTPPSQVLDNQATAVLDEINGIAERFFNEYNNRSNKPIDTHNMETKPKRHTADPSLNSSLRAIEAWYKAKPSERDCFMITVKRDPVTGRRSVSSHLIGDTKRMTDAIKRVMNSTEEDNVAGSILRVAAFNHLQEQMANAEPTGDEPADSAEPQSSEE